MKNTKRNDVATDETRSYGPRAAKPGWSAPSLFAARGTCRFCGGEVGKKAACPARGDDGPCGGRLKK